MATFEKNLDRIILQAIHERVAEMVDEEEAKAVARVQERIRSEVASVAAAVFQNFSLERNGPDICIRIQDRRGK